MALERFGKGTLGAKEHDLYLESVPDGIPPLAASFRKRCTQVAGTWKVLAVWQPEANDLAASKLKRYAPKDRDDLRHLCDKGFLQEEKLRRSLEGAFLWETEESGDSDRERAFANLEKVTLPTSKAIRAICEDSGPIAVGSRNKAGAGVSPCLVVSGLAASWPPGGARGVLDRLIDPRASPITREFLTLTHQQ